MKLKIQKIDFEDGEFITFDNIDYSFALESFSNFDWNWQLAAKKEEDLSPSIILSNSNLFLKVRGIDLNFFQVLLIVPGDKHSYYTLNCKSEKVSEIVKLFFEDKIKELSTGLNLSGFDVQNIRSGVNDKNFHYSCKPFKFELLVILSVFSLNLVFFIGANYDFFVLFGSILWLPLFYLYLNYFLNSNEKQLYLSRGGDRITLSHGAKKYEFDKSEIDKVIYRHTEGNRNVFEPFFFVTIFLKDGRHFTINSFLISQKQVLLRKFRLMKIDEKIKFFPSISLKGV